MMPRISITQFRLAVLLAAGHASLFAQTSRVPEGSYSIAFASFVPIRTNIFIANRDGNNPKSLLATPDFDFNPCFSRDGAWIVFTWLRGRPAHMYCVHTVRC